MAEQVAVPAGFDPNNAVPSDATNVAQRGNPAPTIPALAPAGAQQPGFVTPPAAPAGVDVKEFEAFKAWQEAQKKAATPAPATPVPAAATPAPVEPMGAAESVALAKEASAADPYLKSSFQMFSLAAPELDLARAIGNALDHGDLTRIDIAYINEKGGANAAVLVEAAKGLVQHVNTQVANLTASIHSTAGGEAGWQTNVAVFNQHAPQFVRQMVADGLNSANPERIKQAAAYVNQFAKDSGKVPVHPQGHVSAGGGTPSAALGMSKTDFQAAHAKLNRNDRNYAAQSQELHARRQLGKKMGM